MRSRRTAALLLVCVTAATVAAQEVSEQPDLIKGDRWVYSTHTETFTGREEDRLMFTIQRDGKAERTVPRELSLTSIPGHGGFDPPYRSLQFPLRVGNKWSHSYQAGGVNRNASYSVAKREAISIRGQTYDAFKVEGYDQRADRPNAMYVEIYYAPQVRGIVKVFRRDDNASGTVRQDYELVKFDPGSK